MDDEKVDIDPDLTSSTNDSLLSRNNDKTDANDSTPTSSTDAASSFPGTSSTVSEDPISSTSSDVMEKDKIFTTVNSGNRDKDSVVPKNLLVSDGDVDLLDMNITNVSSELISEDVEDIVQDLENLLGETEPQHDFLSRRKEKTPEEKQLPPLENPLHENIESTLCLPLSDSPAIEDAGVVQIPEANNTQQSITVITENNEGSASNEDLFIINEGQEKTEFKTNISLSETVGVNKSGATQPGTGDEENEVVEDKQNENEAATVSSSEAINIPDEPSRSEEENIEFQNITEVHLHQDPVKNEEDGSSTQTAEVSQSEIVQCEKEGNMPGEILELTEEHSDIDAQTKTDEKNIPQDEKVGEVTCAQQNINKIVGLVDYDSDDDTLSEETVPSNDKMDIKIEEVLSAPSKIVNTKAKIADELDDFPVSPGGKVIQEGPNISDSCSKDLNKDLPFDVTSSLEQSSKQETVIGSTEITTIVSEENDDANAGASQENIKCKEDSENEELKKDRNDGNVETKIIVPIEENSDECTEKESEVLIEEITAVEEDSKGAAEVLIEEITTVEGESEEGSKVLLEEISAVEGGPNDDSEVLLGGINAAEGDTKRDAEVLIGEIATVEGDPEEGSKVFLEEITAVEECPKGDSEVLFEEITAADEDSKGVFIEELGTEEGVSEDRSKVLIEDIEAVEGGSEQGSEVVIEEVTGLEGDSKEDSEVLIQEIADVEESCKAYSEVLIEEITAIEGDTEETSEVLIEETTTVEGYSKTETDVLVQELCTVEGESEVLTSEMPSIEEAAEEIIGAEDILEQKSVLTDLKQSDDNQPSAMEISTTEENYNNAVSSPPNVEEVIDHLESPSNLGAIKERDQSKTKIEDDAEEKLKTANDAHVFAQGTQSVTEENLEIDIAEACLDVLTKNTVELTQSKTSFEEVLGIGKEISQSSGQSMQEKISIESSLTEISATDIFSTGEAETRVHLTEQAEKQISIQEMPTEVEKQQSSTYIEEEQQNHAQAEEQQSADEAQQCVENKESSNTEEGLSIKIVENETILSSVDMQNYAEISCSVASQQVEEPEVVKIQSSDFSYEMNSDRKHLEQSQEPEARNIESSEALGGDSEDLNKDTLTPVNEEICIKKVIIYEHDCDSHSTNYKNTTGDEILGVSHEAKEEFDELEPTEQVIKDVIETPVELPLPEGDKMESIQNVELRSDEKTETVTNPLALQEPSTVQFEDSSIQREISVPDELIESSSKSNEVEPKQEDQCQNIPAQVIENISDEKCEAIVPNLEQPEVQSEHPIDIKIVSSSDEVLNDQQQPSQKSDNLLVKEIETHSEESDQLNPGVLDAGIAGSCDENNDKLNDNEQEVLSQYSVSPEEKMNSNQRQEVSSSDQQMENKKSGNEEFKKQFYPTSSLMADQNLESPQTAKETSTVVPEQAIEDQTSAAVQSILDNMLSEENHKERISEKEEMPVVHSSYSSYEVQKAVQEIQCITETEVEISPEVMESISNLEKPEVPDKTEFRSNNYEVVQADDKNQFIPENEGVIPEEKDVQNYVEPIVSEKIIDDMEHIQQATNSPINYESIVTQSSIDIEEEKYKISEVLEESPSQSKNESCSEIKHQNDPVVIPSIDLSEESSSEEGSDDEKKQNFVSSSSNIESIDLKELTKNTMKEKVSINILAKSESKKISPRETRHSSRISEKGKPQREDFQPLSVNVDEIEREKPYSPKIIIKPIKEDEPNEDKEEHKGSLRITITKQSDNTHSILKMCSPDFEHRQKQPESDEPNLVPKLVIKTSDTHSEQHSPKTRTVKQSLPSTPGARSGSPRITIKPIVKPDAKENITSPLKITIKPIGKPEEFSRQQQKQSPKQTKNKSDEDHYTTRSKVMKSSDSSEVHSPKVTIKPVKPPEEQEMQSTPKITIKPIEKPEEARVSPKITIKPVVRPVEVDTEIEDEVKERIVLKINKGNLPSKDNEKIARESRKRELDDDKSEKLAKIKLKFSKDGDAHIVHKEDINSQHSKRQHDFEAERSKRFKTDSADSDDDVKLIENRQSPIVISEDSQSQDSVIIVESAKDPLATMVVPQPQVPVVTAPRKRGRPRKVPLVVREEFGTDKVTQSINIPPPVVTSEQPPETENRGRPKRSCRAQSVRDTLGIKPRKPSKPRGGKRGGGAKSILMKPGKEPGYSQEKIGAIKSLLTEEAMQSAHCSGILTLSSVKKNEVIKPLGLKGLLEAAKDQNIIEVIEIDSPSNSPKCTETSDTEKTEEVCVVEEELLEKIGEPVKNPGVSENLEMKNFGVPKGVLDDKEPSDFGGADAVTSDVEMQPPTPVFAPPLIETSAMDINSTTDIAMFEEETRMSADVSSRAQTPAKQVVSDVVVEESQSSIQSTATTESGKISRRSRLEVHQDQDGAVFTADQLNEYYWGGNGPFMIQEQVAQFLGIKSFKRKYPGIPRRMVDMQERDYIRENGLASEAMCDLGLTAVNSADILDIMYTDFQEKYEEFCRFQRDKQAKDLLNKQKALALAANQEKSKLDILEQAVQSAAAYNANFNKTRREQRRACMDLQTMNIHYPKGKMKKISTPKIGHYPVAVVPGQFTDYYKEFTPTELNNLPLNTMLYTELYKILPEVSDSDSDSSASDSDDSSSSGSESNSSCEENCKMCEKRSVTPRKSPINSSV